MRANVYIDGFNLYYGALKQRPACKWLDLEKLCRHLIPKDTELNRIRYFTARVGGRAIDPQQPKRQDAYLRALATIPGLTVHEGQFKEKIVRLPLANSPRHSPQMVEVIRSEEKGSDVNLATHLMLDGHQQDAEVVVVVSDDFDLYEPLRVAKSVLGLRVGVASPRRRRWLSTAVPVHFYKPVKESWLLASQFPESLADGAIRKPDAWIRPSKG